MIPIADRSGQVWMLDEGIDSWIAVVISSDPLYGAPWPGGGSMHSCVCRLEDGRIVLRPWSEGDVAWENIRNFVRVL